MAALQAIRRLADRIWVGMGGSRHLVGPTDLGRGRHDCAPASLYRVVPWIREDRIIEAFQYCTDAWPYAGVTNKEFQIAVKYLEVDAHYSGEEETVGSLLDRRPARCIALVPYHYIGIISGKILGRDTGMSRSTTVYCHWTFRSPRFLSVSGKRRSFGGTT